MDNCQLTNLFSHGTNYFGVTILADKDCMNGSPSPLGSSSG